MRMIIEARIDDGVGGEAIRLAEFERLDGDLEQLGLNLAEGRSLVHEAQRALICAQTRVVVSASPEYPKVRWGIIDQSDPCDPIPNGFRQSNDRQPAAARLQVRSRPKRKIVQPARVSDTPTRQS